jgi:predicted PurR-regulated permease PerM
MMSSSQEQAGDASEATGAAPVPAAGAGPVARVDLLGFLGGRGRLVVLGVATLIVLWLARGIIGPFVVAAVLAYAFSPVVSAVEDRTHAPRAVVVIAGYLAVLGVFAVAAVLVAERAASEIHELSSGGPDVIASALQKVFGSQVVIAGTTYNVNDVAAQIRASLFGLVRTPSDAFHVAEQGVAVALQTVLTLIVTFYFLLDGRRFGQYAMRFLDRSQRSETTRIAHRIHVVLGHWLRGQMFLIGLVAVVLYVVLGPILHVHYALALAIVSGVLEIIPLVGPIIAAALAGTVAFATRGTDTTIAVLLVYVVVRQIEDQVIMPLVIGRAVHLHPVVTIFAVLVGLSVWGILGGLLAVPVAAALNVTLHELYPDETDSPASEPVAGSPVKVRFRPERRRLDGATRPDAPQSGPAAEEGGVGRADTESPRPGMTDAYRRELEGRSDA